MSRAYLLERDFSLGNAVSSGSTRPAGSQSAQTLRMQRNLEALLEVSLASARVLDDIEQRQPRRAFCRPW